MKPMLMCLWMRFMEKLQNEAYVYESVDETHGRSNRMKPMFMSLWMRLMGEVTE
ncbi:hypothetical protein DPMN_048979 [Dreissena polymorpha]|uniref:Uncharacterized protein n=1 Tax=Dreissena polymorpha TaxID=45954 RepID=A0A9D4DCI2_DREPO|nr:hypothetical protein DPMN_048979 [Dreissena polymorpha]